MVAFTGVERQDVIIDTPTLWEMQIDLTFTNYIGLYEPGSAGESTSTEALAADLAGLSAEVSWPEPMYRLGLMDDYVNEGVFSDNVLKQLSVLKNYQEMIES